jgi:hypothetical protein
VSIVNRTGRDEQGAKCNFFTGGAGAQKRPSGSAHRRAESDGSEAGYFGGPGIRDDFCLPAPEFWGGGPPAPSVGFALLDESHPVRPPDPRASTTASKTLLMTTA